MVFTTPRGGKKGKRGERGSDNLEDANRRLMHHAAKMLGAYEEREARSPIV